MGDVDQTIYTFAGATPEHLEGFGRRYPGAKVIPLLSNYRSSPQVLALANRLLAAAGGEKQLVATQEDGPEPVVRSFGSAAEEEAFVVARVRELIARWGRGRRDRGAAAAERADRRLRVGASRAPASHIRLRGKRFFERREVRAAVRGLERVPEGAAGDALVAALRREWLRQLGFDPDEEPEGREARERHASLSTLLAIVVRLVGEEGARRGIRSRPRSRHGQSAERADDAEGVELLTLHRAKGLEWDAVFIPMLEEGSLPVSQAADEVAIAEERRLLYVGITRARRYLALSWAQQRVSPAGRSQSRVPSRFLAMLGAPGSVSQVSIGASTASLPRAQREPAAARARLRTDDALLFDALRAWRLERARADKVSPFIVAYDTVLAEIAERRPPIGEPAPGHPWHRPRESR